MQVAVIRLGHNGESCQFTYNTSLDVISKRDTWGAFLWKNLEMGYCMRSHGLFFAKETKKAKRN